MADQTVIRPTIRAADETRISNSEPRPDNGYNYGSFPASGRETETAGRPKHAETRTRALAPDLLRGLLMAIMAMDHNALALNTWQHGTGRDQESDSLIIRQWNRPAAYTVRTLTHLCGSGFTLLLGMGVVYLGRSRTRLGWSSLRLAKYFAVRCLVLTGVTVVMGVVMTGGKVWFLNMVLFALAADYFLAGMLWLAINKTEPALARFMERFLEKHLDDEDAEQPLMGDDRPVADRETPSEYALSVSWHLHNAALFVLSVVTIFWNVWLSDTQGHCQSSDSSASTNLSNLGIDGPEGPVFSTPKHPLLALWFWPVMSAHIMSGFPPMAWVSFAILGLLYGRILVAKTWRPRAVALGHLPVALLFLVIFVLTRVLRIGNLSENCLKTPDEEHYTGGNQYLASPQAFFYLVKYPPDVAFWAFTLFGNFILLGIFGAIPTSITKRFSILLDFGTAALFFYVIHLFVLFAIGAILVSWFGHDVGTPNPMNPDSTQGIDNIFGYFGAWALGMLILWPLTRWYSRFKSTKPADSIWRFF